MQFNSFSRSSNQKKLANNELASHFVDEYLNPYLATKYSLHAALISALNKLQPIGLTDPMDANNKQPLYIMTRNFNQNVRYRRTVDANSVLKSTRLQNLYRKTSTDDLFKTAGPKRKYDVFGRKYGHTSKNSNDAGFKNVIDFRMSDYSFRRRTSELSGVDINGNESSICSSEPPLMTGDALADSPSNAAGPHVTSSGFNFTTFK